MREKPSCSCASASTRPREFAGPPAFAPPLSPTKELFTFASLVDCLTIGKRESVRNQQVFRQFSASSRWAFGGAHCIAKLAEDPKIDFDLWRLLDLDERFAEYLHVGHDTEAGTTWRRDATVNPLGSAFGEGAGDITVAVTAIEAKCLRC